MVFEVVPILDTMLDLYKQPRSAERFNAYLSILEGEKRGDMTVPVGGFNPMAKAHLPEKLRELKELNAEMVIQNLITTSAFGKFELPDTPGFKVVLNLADDAKGAWTNRYTTDYDSKFRFNGVFKRGFCTPYFWSSETYSKKEIEQRAAEYIYRTIYRCSHPLPGTLEEHVAQESFVAQHVPSLAHTINPGEVATLHAFYEAHKHSDDYNLIFNFFYGDEVCATLAFPAYGIAGPFNGFDFARTMPFRS